MSLRGANRDIDNFLNRKLHLYIGFNFDFKPYKKNESRKRKEK